MNAAGEGERKVTSAPLHNSGRRCHPGPYEGSDQTPSRLWHTAVMPYLAWRPTLRHQTAARTTPEDPPPGGVNSPGMSGDSIAWEGWSHAGRFNEAVPAGAEAAGGADGHGDRGPARLGVGGDGAR